MLADGSDERSRQALAGHRGGALADDAHPADLAARQPRPQPVRNRPEPEVDPQPTVIVGQLAAQGLTERAR